MSTANPSLSKLTKAKYLTPVLGEPIVLSNKSIDNKAQVGKKSPSPFHIEKKEKRLLILDDSNTE